MANEAKPITLSGVAGLGSFLLILGSAVFLGWQVYTYLKAGIWPERSVIDLMLAVDSSWAWALNPASWIGVWKILHNFSASGFLFLSGIFFGWVAFNVE